MIDISFDPKKDAANRRKHGISLSAARDFDMDTAWVEVDNSQDYGEVRFIAIGWLHVSLFTMTFTMEAGIFRIINLRHSKHSERDTYAANS